ncbi:MAG: glycosyltransferase [Gammaproteobacteria bacterium]|nr:glycosyltransferase [Gammaproteobacteria bacterium]
MNTPPLVSVLIRTKDRKAMLQETLESVFSQTYDAVEILILNDGGEDFSTELLANADNNVRWINNTGEHGRSSAANLALIEAKGNYCLFLDDDDSIDAEHISNLVSALGDSPDYKIAYSAVRTISNEVKEKSPSFAFAFDPVRLMIENYIPIHAVLFDRELSKNFKFDTAFDRFEDWDFWLQLAESQPFLFVDKCTANYRVDSNSGFGAKENPEESMDTYRFALFKKWLALWPQEKLLALIDRSREFPRIEVLEKAINELKENLNEKDGFNSELNTRIEERDNTILKQQKELVSTTLKQQKELVSTTRELHAAEQDLNESENELRNQLKQKQTLLKELQVIHNSRSWKLTKPLRLITKLRYFLRTEGIGGVMARIRIKLAVRGRRIKKITPDSPVTEQFSPLAFTEFEQPDCSIVIPVYNQYPYTFHCLKSLLDHSRDESFEVIVVDDCSSDKTQEMLAGVSGIRVVKNTENLGFIKSCNAGAEAARGEYLVILNNDTEVRDGWLIAMRQTFSDFPDAGLVGARLVFADGSLQEAGGIVWRDGSAWNYGRGDDPNIPDYAYCRQADYCSGACLMIPLKDFKELGGFDTHYAPAYYEDTDLAFKVREAGKKVYVQPNATIIHFEGITSGTDTGSGAKQYQDINHKKFTERWQNNLNEHRPNGRLPQLEKERHVKKRILIIDARVLMPDHDSGSLRMFNILKILQKLEYKVTFVPANLHHHEKYTPQMQAIGIECQYQPYVQSVSKYLEDHGLLFDAVILSRADYAEKYIDDVRQYCPNAQVLFDTVDLHFLREQREAELNNDKALMDSAVMRKSQELAVARKADVTLVVSPVELELFREEAPDINVSLLSNVHEMYATGKTFSERKDMLFIGNFEHPPNTDAMEFFLNEIFPLVHKENPDLNLLIVGGHAPSHLKARATKQIQFTGFIVDITPLFENIRLSIAPLRYGAGVKGKINSSMSYGVPAVVTSMAAEGMNLDHGKDILIADEAEEFAREILRLYADETLWKALSKAGKENIETHFSFTAAEAQLREVLPG